MTGVAKRRGIFAITMLSLAGSTASHAAEVAECSLALGLQTHCLCAVSQLHPTQITVGIQQVREKERELAKKSVAKLGGYLRSHPAPAVWGPGGALYIIDHHHLSRALWNRGGTRMYCEIKANFSADASAELWEKMETMGWAYPYDESGTKRESNAIPPTVAGLRDDPYRSLAGYVRDACGYEKSNAVFAEFRWAEYFRKQIPIKPSQIVETRIIDQAIAYARSDAAANLPGYCGNHCSCR